MMLEDIFSISKGKKPPELFDRALADSIPFIKIDGIRNAGQHQYCEPVQGLIVCDESDVLVVWDGAYCGLTGFGLSGAIGSTIARLRPKTAEVFGPYAGHFLQSKFREIQNNATGAAIPHVNGGHLRRLEIPLPPINEQKRIAAVLDKADALRRQRQESLQLTEKLLQSVFIDMFVHNPDATDWTRQTVAWMANNAKGSMRTGPFGSQLLHSEFVDRGVAVLGIDNAVRNRFEWGQPRFITSEKYQNLKRYKVFPGDLIITIMGTLGRCAIVPDDIPESINTKHLCCITLDHEKCLPEFLHAAFLSHPEVLRQLGVRTKGAVMPGLNIGIIKDLALPVPPIELQKEFKRIVTICTTSRADLEDSQDTLGHLFDSIQQRALRGELDLSRLVLDEENEPTPLSPVAAILPGRYKDQGSFNAPPDVEAQLIALESKLYKGTIDYLPWSSDFFKYRTLSKVLNAPFNFEEVWYEAAHDMPDATYEIVKDQMLEFLEQGVLEQRFDEVRKEIVFYPRA